MMSRALLGGCLKDGGVREDLVHDGPGRERAVQRGCAELKHLGLECWAPLPDLPPTRFVPARRVGTVARDKPIFLGAVVDSE
jgi:hypothetical protein